MDEASEQLEAALVTVRSHLVQVLAPTDSPGTRRQKKQLADLTRKKLYELVQMLEEDDGEEDEEEEEEPEHIQRYNSLIEEFDANAKWNRLLTARLFHLCMTRPVETGASAEHKGLLRLLFSYADKPGHWARALQTPLQSLQDWDEWCHDSQANDTQQDFHEQLVFLPKMICAFNAESDAQSFVKYVLRVIETLKFIQRWNQRERDDGQRARKWKIKFIEKAFLLSNSENHDLKLRS
ncbi:hypothetical protein EDD85DRAFT_821324 [Armillaria nabsnona]|nr:hypothetical protein EDD85DRAFT_821324 [Armillaria nabsnona]